MLAAASVKSFPERINLIAVPIPDKSRFGGRDYRLALGGLRHTGSYSETMSSRSLYVCPGRDEFACRRNG